MKLIALFVAILLERLATQLFHLRELRWLDGLFDFGLRLAQRFDAIPKLLGVAATVLLVASPIILLRLGLGDVLLGLPYLALSVVVLFFSLGPQDIGEEVDRWSNAIRAGDEEEARRLAHALVEHRTGEDDVSGGSAVQEAVCVQANNRMFAVLFWFVVLGPVGAWTFRVADLLRRRAVFQAERLEAQDGAAGEEDAVRADQAAAAAAREATEQAHALLAWLPARLTALGYALTGSFDTARHAWSTLGIERVTLGLGNERLLARVGLGAMSVTPLEGESEEQRQIRGAHAAKTLVFRTLVFWLAAIAALTLAGAAI
jgi:AmpE protein